MLTGWLAATAGARSGLIVGAVAALLAGAWGLFFGGTSRQVATGETGASVPEPYAAVAPAAELYTP